MAKPRLLSIVTQAELGGAQKYVFELAMAFKGEFDVTVTAGDSHSPPSPSRERVGVRGAADSVISSSFDLLDRCRTAGIATATIRHLVRPIHPWHDLAAIFELVGLYRALKPDIVHLNSSKAGVLGSLAAAIFKTTHYALRTTHSFKIIYTIHGWAFLEPIGAFARAIYFLAEWVTGRTKHALIALSEYERQIGIRLRIAPAPRFTVIPHGIDPAALNLLPRESARHYLTTHYSLLSTHSIWIGTIANLYPTKGLDILLRAFAQLATKQLSNLATKQPNEEATQQLSNSATKLSRFVAQSLSGSGAQSLNLILIGDGPQRAELETLARLLGIGDCVILAGAIPDAAQYLKAFDLFVLPSRKEGLPWTILEAAAAGIPIVATRVGGIPELLRDGKEALLVPADDPRTLAWAIEELIANHALQEKLAHAARNRITTEFSKEAMLTLTRACYLKQLGN